MQHFTRKANSHVERNLLAEQHVHWREQGKNALDNQQAGLERAAQEYEKEVRHEVHVAVIRVTEMSRAEMLATLGALEPRAEQSWTSP